MPDGNLTVRLIRKYFSDLSLNSLVLVILIFYLIVISISAIFIIVPFAKKRFVLLFAASLALFFISLGVFGVRYYDEDILKRGIIVQKEVDCKYEPIDKSTTYYKLHEGSDVLILKTRDGWTQIKRLDGKIAWVNKESVGEI